MRGLEPACPRTAAELGRQIRTGRDPLGETLATIRSPAERRPLGATYTPELIVEAMVAWAAAQAPPARVVDPGAGSGRFLVAAAGRLAGAQLVGVEIDPLAALLCRANLAAAGHARRSWVLVDDYRRVQLPPMTAAGRTLFIGNPPYVRHHLIEPEWKRWLVEEAGRFGLPASQLAGLHVHFLLATARLGEPGDLGTFITAAEWLDVNYGRLVRELVLGQLGGRSLHVIAPTARPFVDAATTAAITCFELGAEPRTLRLRRVASLATLPPLAGGGRPVRRERLAEARRWSPLFTARRASPRGYVELGELCRVHRGQVTGANRVWIAGPHADGLPASVLFPSVTHARELIAAGRELTDPTSLRRVIDLPMDLTDRFGPGERRAIDRFLRYARTQGADRGYIARARRAWWSVGLREPAPILATYMARRPPVFVRNRAQVRHLNIAHGLYPRVPLGERALAALVRHLSGHVSMGQGRTYAGGLTKFEPREMERLLIPGPELLAADDPTSGPRPTAAGWGRDPSRPLD